MARNICSTLLTLLVLSSPVLHAEGVVFFQGTWEEALDRAAKENKYIMVDAYTDWCGWCKVMDKETFTDDAVGAMVNKNFVPVKINFEEGIGIDLGMKFRVSSYPTILFFNPAGQLVRIQNGYMYDNADFIASCQKALDVKEERVYAFDSRELNPPFPEFYRTSFIKGENRAWPEEEEIAAYLDKQEDLLSEVNWSVIWRFGGGEKYQTYVLEHIDEYEERYGQDQVRNVATNWIYREVYNAAQEKDEEMLEEAIALIDQYEVDDDPERLKLWYTKFYYEQTEDWTNYVEATETLLAKTEVSNDQINTICWELYERINDQKLLLKAIEWMKPVIEEEGENWYYVDTYAALLYKTGNMAEAEKYARKAIRIGKEQGEDVTSTEELLQKILGNEVSEN